MNRPTPVGYAFGVFFVAGVIEFLLLKSPGFEVPISRLVWASGFYAVPVFVATWLVTRIRTTYALPVVGVPARRIGWMSLFGERIPLPLEGDGEYRCPHLGHRYLLEKGAMRNALGGGEWVPKLDPSLLENLGAQMPIPLNKHH